MLNKSMSKLPGIQALRALAAFLVLFQHVIYYSTNARDIDYNIFLKINYGHIGVSLFFVISGFVMSKCMGEDNFLANRAIRIYPGFWLTIFLSFLILGFFSEWQFDLSSSFLMSINNSYKIPYWTLIFEIFFYGVIFLFSKISQDEDTIFYLFCAWLVLIYAFNQYQPVAEQVPGKLILFSPFNYFFIMGFLFSLYMNDIKKMSSNLLFTLGISMWIFSQNLDFTNNPYLIEAIAYGFLLLYSLEKFNHSLLVKLGDYSYGIYLIHVPIALFIIHFLLNWNPQLSLKYLCPITFLFTVIFASLYGYFEFKMHALLKKLMKSKLLKMKSVRIKQESMIKG